MEAKRKTTTVHVLPAGHMVVPLPVTIAVAETRANAAVEALNGVHVALRDLYAAEPEGPFRDVLGGWTRRIGRCIRETSDVRRGARYARKAFKA